ncbi:putative amidase, partial [Lachnellula suecica]
MVSKTLRAGMTLALISLSSAWQKPTVNASQILESQTLHTPYPYEFPVLQNGSNANNGQFPMPLCRGFKLEEASIDQLQQAMSNGTLTSVQMVLCYLKRVYQTDEYIQAVMEINPDMLDIAEALDIERSQGHVRGPLHGIPFLVKDNIGTKDKVETTAGSWMLLGSVIPRDAHVVHLLREAGAVLMGHATLSEWADMRSNSYSEGYSARGGQARSPYNLTTNPGGSSSGSAGAVSANLVPFALGTETDGSVINPAERNALVGIKPTVGLTSRAGVIPESHNQDTVGCLTKTVRDGAYCLDAIYGPDPRDNYTLIQQAPAGGYAQFLTNKGALKGATFGIPWLSFWQWASEDQVQQLLELIDLIESAGATIINGTELPHWETIVSPNGWDWDYGGTRGFPNESEYTYVKSDFYNDIAAYLAELNNTAIRSLEDIVQYNIDNVGSEGGIPNVHPAFKSGQDGFNASLATGGVMDQTYWEALSFCHRTTREEGIDAALFSNGTNLNALLVPPDVGQTYQIAAQAGYPMVTLPAGVSAETGMPFGLALMGTAWSEASLIKYASAIEDLQVESGTKYKRTSPLWLDYRTVERSNICIMTGPEASGQASLPTSNSTKAYWHRDPSKVLFGHRTTPTLPTKADVIIIGSGISGASAARYLREDAQGKDLNIVMLEAREACWGATGRNGGHCQPQIYNPDPEISAFELRNYQTIKALVEKHSIPCEWRSVPGCHAYFDNAMFANSLTVVETLLRSHPELGELIKVLTKDSTSPSLADLRVPTAAGAFLQTHAASLWPYKLVSWMLEDLLTSNATSKAKGSFNLQTNTPATHLQQSPDKKSWIVHTPRGMLAAPKVLLTTNGYTSHLLPAFSEPFVPVRGEMSALVSPESTGEKNKLEYTYGFMGNDEQDIDHDDYLIQRPFSDSGGGELMFGGGRSLAADSGLGVSDDSALDPPAAAYLRRSLNTLLHLNPENPEEELEATYEWSGIMGYSRDGHPWVGQVGEEMGGGEGLWICAGYTGHGMPNACLSGNAVAEMMM